MHTVLIEEGHPLALRETVRALIVNGVGSNLFRELFVQAPDGTQEVIHDGDLACTIHTSAILYLLNLIKGGVHTTVVETEADLLRSGWQRAEIPALGSVVIWSEKVGDDGHRHRHIGLCLDEQHAVSNDPKQKSPQMHGIWSLLDHEGNPRPVEAFYIHPSLT